MLFCVRDRVGERERGGRGGESVRERRVREGERGWEREGERGSERERE